MYLDSEFNVAYRTGDQLDMAGTGDKSDPDETYIIATWTPGDNYEVETGYFCKNASGQFCRINDTGAVVCTPTIQEIYLSDYTFTVNGIFNTATGNKIVLPYIANDGLVANMDLTDKKYKCNPESCVDSNNKRI